MYRTVRSWLALVLLSFAAPAFSAQVMSVEEAYRAIPHGRTVFKVKQAKMGQASSRFLSAIFDMIDEAIVLKMTSLTRGVRADAEGYAKLRARMDALPTPEGLSRFKEQVMEAIDLERDYLSDNPKVLSMARDTRVSRASSLLKSAYSQLMEIYPAENGHNKKAFFDYLCALDFL